MPKNKSQRAKAAVKAAVDAAGGTKALVQKIDKLADSVNKMKMGPMAKGGQRIGKAMGVPGLGRLAGSLAGRLTGSGDYNVAVNSLIHPGSERGYAVVQNSPSSAQFSRAGDVIRVRKREFVGNLFSPPTANGFSASSYRLNPGNPKLFPWLSSVMGQGYEQYRPLGIVIELVSVASEYATGGTLGVFGASIDYQSLDPPYASMMEAENSDGAVSTKVSNDLMFGVECAPDKRPYNLLYVRQETSGVNTTSTGINAFDLGNVQLIVQGVPTPNLLLAQVWVSYDIEFEKQQLVGGPFGGGTTTWGYQNPTVSNGQCLGTQTGNTTQYGSLFMPLYSQVTAPTSTGNGYVWTPTAGGATVCLPDWLQGVFQLTVIWYSSSNYTGTYTPPVLGATGTVGECSAWFNINGIPTVNGPFFPGFNGAQTSVENVCYIRFINCSQATQLGGNTLTFGGSGILPSVAGVVIVLTQISASLTAQASLNYGLPQITAPPW
jgi:hypothetical protein